MTPSDSYLSIEDDGWVGLRTVEKFSIRENSDQKSSRRLTINCQDGRLDKLNFPRLRMSSECLRIRFLQRLEYALKLLKLVRVHYLSLIRSRERG